MFDDAGIEIDQEGAMEALAVDRACGDADWKALHRRLRSIAKRRAALEAEEASCLIEAEETRA